jgi:hypothetical protein
MSVWTPLRHVGGRGRAPFILKLGTAYRSAFHASLLYPGTRTMAGDGCGPQPVWIACRREKTFTAAGNRTLDRPTGSLVTVPTELHRPFSAHLKYKFTPTHQFQVLRYRHTGDLQASPALNPLCLLRQCSGTEASCVAFNAHLLLFRSHTSNLAFM